MFNIDSSQTKGGFMSNSQGDRSTDKRVDRKEEQTLLPVTIKQLHDSEASMSDNSKIDGQILSQVTFIAIITNIEESDASTRLQVHDGTGQITVQIWHETDTSIYSQGFEPNTYIRVIGKLKVFKNNKSIIAYNAEPISDFNEITFHWLEALHCHLLKTRGSKQHVSTTAITYDGNADEDGFSPIQKSIMEIYWRSQELETGVSIHELSDILKLSVDQLKKQTRILVDEGHLYETMDEDHLRSTGGFGSDK